MNNVWDFKKRAFKLAFIVLGFGFLTFLNVGLITPFAQAATCSATSITAGESIRACQVENMRSLINQARAACANGSIAPYSFTDDPIVPDQTKISVRHMDEMKAAISEIATLCPPTRAAMTFTNLIAGDKISIRDFAYIYNQFVNTAFCGDAIQQGGEDITTCSVDSGGAANYYCNDLGTCYASNACPTGKTCYTSNAGCLATAAADCDIKWYCDGALPCVNAVCPEGATCFDDQASCTAAAKCTICISDCSCANSTCSDQTCSDGCGGTCTGQKNCCVPDCSCASTTGYGWTCGDNVCSTLCAGAVNYAPNTYGQCNQTVINVETVDNNDFGFLGIDGFYVYRCDGVCTPTDADLIASAVDPSGDYADTAVILGQKYSYSTRLNYTATGLGPMSLVTTATATHPVPDCSCATSICSDQTCSAATCPGSCIGTANCSSTPIVYQQCPNDGTIFIDIPGCDAIGTDKGIIYRCAGTCPSSAAVDISGPVTNCTDFADTTAVMGQTYTYFSRSYQTSTGVTGPFSSPVTYKMVSTINPCPCASTTWFDDVCDSGCGICHGTVTQVEKVYQKCEDNTAIWMPYSSGNYPTQTGFYIYRCDGACVPKDSDRISPLVADYVIWGDTTAVMGQTYTYSKKPVFSDGYPGIFSMPMTYTMVPAPSCSPTCVPNCSCAASTCIGATCSNGCGGSCSGTKTCTPTVWPAKDCPKTICNTSGFCAPAPSLTCSCSGGLRPVCRSAPILAPTCGGSCPSSICTCVP